MCLDEALIELDIHKSYMRSRRLIQNSGITVNDIVITDYRHEVDLECDKIEVVKDKREF